MPEHDSSNAFTAVTARRSTGPRAHVLPLATPTSLHSRTVLFETEERQGRAEIATTLRTIADSLEAGDPISLRAGDQSITVEPPSRPVFEVKVEREGLTEGTGELSVEFELEWDEDGDESANEDGRLEVE